MRGFDLDAFEERAAIMEFDGGLSRFDAETAAAKAQGFKRWEIRDAIGKRDTEGRGDQRSPDARQPEDAMPRVQRASKEEIRSMSERVVSVGLGGLALLALFVERGPVL